MGIQFVKKNGDIVKICRPKINRFQFKNSYNISLCDIQDTVKAINEASAMFKFCLKHPLVLFHIDNLEGDGSE